MKKRYYISLLITIFLLGGCGTGRSRHESSSEEETSSNYDSSSSLSSENSSTTSETPQTYKITFYDPSHGKSAEDITVTKNEKFTPPSLTSVTGYTFSYWRGSDGRDYYPNIEVTFTSNENLILTAIWETNIHTLSWNLDGGVASNIYTYGEVEYGTNIIAPIPSKLGNIFIGWNDVIPGIMPDNDLSFTAIYTRFDIIFPIDQATLTDTGGEVTVQWVDESSDVDFYEIFISETITFPATGYISLAGSDSYTFNGLDIGHTYYVKLVSHLDTTTYVTPVYQFSIDS